MKNSTRSLQMTKLIVLTITMVLAIIFLSSCALTQENSKKTTDDLSPAQTPYPSLPANLTSEPKSPSALLALTEQILDFENNRHQEMQARKDGKTDQAKQLSVVGLSIFKSFDPLVSAVNDSDLSKYWGETWPQGAQQTSETKQTVQYVYSGYGKFLGRLSLLIKISIDTNQVPAITPAVSEVLPTTPASPVSPSQ
jgi:hypothetical protein